jgi:hypothetical protein
LYERVKGDAGALLRVIDGSVKLRSQAARLRQGWAVFGELDALEAELAELHTKIVRIGDLGAAA